MFSIQEVHLNQSGIFDHRTFILGNEHLFARFLIIGRTYRHPVGDVVTTDNRTTSMHTVPRTLPSSILAYFRVSRTNGSDDASAACSSGHIRWHSAGSASYQVFYPAPICQTVDSERGSFCTRATSLIASLVAIVPYVMICATFS